MFRIEIAETDAGFMQLAEDWRALAARVPGCHFTQTYEWLRLGWLHRPESSGDKLICATIRDGERLVAVWPFVQRTHSGVRTLDPVTAGLDEEYAEPLLDPGVDAAALCRQLLDAVARHADILRVHYLAEGSDMRAAIAARRCVKLAVRIDALAIDRRDAPSWDAAMATYSKNMRENMRKARRRLGEQGSVRFELVEDPEAQAAAIDWLLAQKQAWLQRRDKSRHWFFQPRARHFLIEAARLDNAVGRLGLFTLTLDGVPIAATFTTIDRQRVEMQVSSFDPAYARFSPGMLLVQDVARWSHERGLFVDMRMLRVDYKERWATRISQCTSFFMALTPIGLARLAPDLLRIRTEIWLEAHLSPERFARIKASAKRLIRIARPGKVVASIEPSA